MVEINKYLIFKIAAILLFFLCNASYSIHIPEIPYFPVAPNYGFTLVSDKGNTINMSLRIAIPKEGETINKFFLNWLMIFKFGDDKLTYSVQLTLLSNGNIYLGEMRDGAYERFFPPEIVIFPSPPVFDREIDIGENMSFRFIRYINRFSDARLSRLYYNVIEGELKLLDINYQIYFSKDNGIIMIRTPDETFRQQ